jgi:hypothetical protein
MYIKVDRAGGLEEISLDDLAAFKVDKATKLSLLLEHYGFDKAKLLFDIFYPE